MVSPLVSCLISRPKSPMKLTVALTFSFVTQLYFSLGDAVIGGVLTSARAEAAPRDPKADSKAKLIKKTKSSKKKSAPTKKAVDYNAPGVAAFNKGNFSEALAKFDVATKKDPKNPLSWLNHARAVVALNGANDPSDYCDFDRNWILLALSSLSSSWTLDRIKTVKQLGTFTDSSFKKFQLRPEYKKWTQLARLPLGTDLKTQEFFAQNNDWLIPNAALPSTVVTFAPSHEFIMAEADGARDVGQWTAGIDRVIIKTKQTQRTLNLTSAPSPIGKTGRSYQQVVLKDIASRETWSIGPEIADCPQ